MREIQEQIREQMREWIEAEERAGRVIDEKRLDQYARLLMRRHNNTAREDFNGLTPAEMHYVLHYPFSDKCVVQINRLNKEQYEKIPLVRQTLFLLNILNEREQKLTKLGWLPQKIVAETYPLGQPLWYIDEFNKKRINEYEAYTVWMARMILDLLGWIKTRKGMLSITAKGRKALANIENAGYDILFMALTGAGLQGFDGYEDPGPGNLGRAYSVWLLHKYGSEWHSGAFYREHYNKVMGFHDTDNAYATRVFGRLFYWLGIVEKRRNKESGEYFDREYRATELFTMIFSFKR